MRADADGFRRPVGPIAALALAAALSLGALCPMAPALAEGSAPGAGATATTPGAAAGDGAAKAPEPDDQATPDGAADEPGDARPAGAETAVVVEFDPDQHLVVPYGVDVAPWLSEHATFLVDGRRTSAADLSRRHFGGRDVLRRVEGAAYPANHADGTPIDWSAYVEFAEPEQGGADLDLPSLSTLGASVGWTDDGTPGAAAALPLAPEGVARGISGTRADGAAATLPVTGTWARGDVTLWLSADDLAEGASPLTLDGGEAALSSALDLSGDGAFANDDPVRASGPATVYARLGRDVGVPGTQTTFEAGQVVRVPVAADTVAPRVTDLAVAGPDGQAADFSAPGVVDGGLVTVTRDGLVLSARVAEADPAEGSGESASGLESGSVALLVGDRRVAASSVADGVATFELDVDSLGAGTFLLADMSLVAADRAGNEATLPLDGQEPFASAGVTAIELFDEDAPENRASASIRLGGRAAADGGTTVTNDAGGLALELQATDPNFDRTEGYDDLASWRDALTAGSASSDVTTPLAYDDFVRVQGTDSWRAPGGTVAAEGTHELTFTYRGRRALFGWIVLEKVATHTVVVDRTAPQATEAQVEGFADADPNAEFATVGGTAYLVGGPRTVRVRLADLLPDGSPEGASGVDESSIRVTVGRDQDLGGTPGVTNEYRVGGEGGLVVEDGWVEVPLDGEGVYRLSDVRLSCSDEAGNPMGEVTLAEVVGGMGDKGGWTAPDGSLLGGVVVDDPTTDPASAELRVAAAEGVPDSALPDAFRGDVEVTLAIDDPWFELYRATPAGSAATVLTGTLEPGAGAVDAPAEKIASPALADFADEDGDGTWTCAVALPEDAAGVVEGDYDLALSYAGLAGADAAAGDERAFLVDRTAPRATAATLDGPVDAATELSRLDDGTSYLVGGGRTVRVRVQDLLRGVRPAEGSADAGARDQAHTAGVAADEVVATVTRADGMTPATDPTNPSHTTTETLSLVPDDEGWVEVPLEEEGLYRLDSILLTVPDEAGNGAGEPVSLAAAIAGLPADERAEWELSGAPLTGIIVDDPATAPSAGVDVSDGTDEHGDPIEPSLDPLFHRGQTNVVVWVEDPWFEAWRHVPARTEGFSEASIVRAGSDEAQALVRVDPARMAYDAASGRWQLAYSLPRASATDDRPVEGMYTVDLAYRGVSGTADEPACDPAPVTFGVDYTGPELGRLELSEVSPLRWGWVFSAGREDVTVGVTDNLSGVRADSGRVSPEGNVGAGDLPVTYRPSDGGGRSLAGTLSFGMGGDAQRLVLSGTTVAVTDRAGNPTTSAPLSGWDGAGGTNVPEGATGVTVDTEAPAIEVSYDNDDVRNGHYYAAGRTATVTLVESNFDLVRANDGDLVVARVGRDGSQAAELCAKDFENPSGDGRTWVASYEFADDADWTLDAWHTDVVGHEAAPYDTAFVVDTQAPQILVTWDNTEVANGMYYKAPRTATIEVRDRNFSPGLGSVATSASDASGAAAPAPGATAWAELEPRQAWGCSAHFGSELHYAMTVTATDLAGNAAEAYEEPEFVIDMTAPEVSIAGVADHAAYADVVAPTISYSDTNFDATFTTYVLTGGRSGEGAYVPGVAEAEGATSRTVSFPDFERTPATDDVYTLDAQMTDLAGNQARQAVTFSVNRFGSNYVLTDGSGNVLGRYLSRPQDVVVHEINASGLDGAAGHAEVVHDADVRPLVAGADYEVGSGTDGASWSDTTYTFPARLFEEDGYYRILLTSRDLAGNLSQNTMDDKNETRDGTAEIAFAVDGTAPSAGLVGVAPGGVYLDPDKRALVDAEDNVGVARARVLVDGAEVASWDNPGTDPGALPEVRLAADGEPHDVEVVVVDRAGNETRVAYDGVVVAGDLLTYVLNTPRLLFGSVAGGIVGVAVAGLAIALALRHRRLARGRNNPFGH